MKSHGRELSPEAELRAFINRLDRKEQKVFRSVRAAVRKRFPTVNELAYDYPDSVVIGYSPTDRGIEGIVAIAARADGAFLYLSHGPQLPDPKKLLQGSGKQTRFIRIDEAGPCRRRVWNAQQRAAVDGASRRRTLGLYKPFTRAVDQSGGNV
jgi:hypothetical protein